MMWGKGKILGEVISSLEWWFTFFLSLLAIYVLGVPVVLVDYGVLLSCKEFIEISLLSPVEISDITLAWRYWHHLLSSGCSYYVIPEARESPMVCESFILWFLRFGVSFSRTKLFSHINFQVCVTYELVINLERVSKLLMNSDLAHPT